MRTALKNQKLTYDNDKIKMIEVGYKTNIDNKNNLSLKRLNLAIEYFEESGFRTKDIHVITVTKAVKEDEKHLCALPKDSIYHTVFQVVVYPREIQREIEFNLSY